MLRDDLLAILGPLPAKPWTPEVLVVERVDCGSYVREKIVLAADAGDTIPAFVLVPKGLTQQAAAIFCHHQHAGNFRLGKREPAGLEGDPNQAYAVELAERGFVAFAPDAIGFEERNWSDGDSFAQYHEFATRLVRGESLLGKVLFDVSLGIDYLQSRIDVDPARIGFLGHSYGGRMAIWASAFDERIVAAVANCGNVTYADSMGRECGIQLEFAVPGILAKFDVDDVLGLAAPRAFLISAGTDDMYSKGARETFDRNEALFPKGRLRLELWEGGHAFTPPMRRACYAFLEASLRS